MSAAGDRLAKMWSAARCVGIDPHPNLLEQWGLEDSAAGLAAFTEAVYEGCAPFAAALKPQVALFEVRFGWSCCAGGAVCPRCR